MIVVGLVVAAVASYMSKKRLESKSDDEIREFLARKLDGKVGEEQLATIQDAVIGGIRGKSASTESVQADDDTDTTEDVSVADEAIEEDVTAETPVDEELVAVEDDSDDESSEKASAE
jgi:hypothetical protein